MKYFVKISVIIAAITTFLYLFLLGIYATPSADDYGFISMVNENGILNLVKTMYYTWQPRFSSFLVNGVLFKYFGYADSLWLHTLLQLTVGYVSVYLLLNGLRIFKDKYFSIIVAILFVNIGLMSLLEISTLYWLCTASYIYAIWSTILLVYFFFYEQNMIVKTMGMIICSLYLGGVAENYTPLVGLMLFIILILRFYKKKTHLWYKDSTNIQIVISIVILFIGFLFVFLGPGNDVRIASTGGSGFMDQFELIPFFTKSIKASIIFTLRLLSKLWYYICAVGIATIIGQHCNIPKIKFTHIIYATIVVIVIIYLSVALGVFAMGWYAPPRAYSYLAFVLIVYSGVIGIAIGQCCKNTNLVCLISSIAITITAVIYIYIEFPVIKQYRADVISVKHKLLDLAKNEYTGIYQVDSIETEHWKNSYSILRNQIQKVLGKPQKYNELYFPYEPFVITVDPTNWRNRGILDWCGGDFILIGWKK